MPTTPGRHPSFEIEGYSGAVRQAIRRIEQDFYITRSFNPVVIGNSHYQAILVRPTDDTSMYLNTDRELLVLFAEYETFEVRTLEAYDKFYDLLENMRVDYSIRFLVSADNNIQRSIANYVHQNPEYPIIVPLTFHKLSSTSNALVSSVRQNYVIRDLFGYQSPLTQEYFFFGRSEIVNTVLDLSRSGQHSSLFGLRKSGKTSSIFAIQRRSKAFNTIVVNVDCQDPAVHARRYDELLMRILNDVRVRCGFKLLPIIKGLSAVDTAERFTIGMSEVTSRIKGQILLIFDEIEQISPATAASDHWRRSDDPVLFWQTLRSFCQTHAAGRLVICLVGTSPYLLETAKINDLDNPVYLFAQKRFIPNLSFDESRQMITRLGFFMGLNFSDQIINRIFNKFGGHPFFTRQVCSKVHQVVTQPRPVEVSVKILEAAEASFDSDLRRYLTDIIESLRSQYDEEYKLLLEVANGNSAEFSEFADGAPELVDHLLGYGLISKKVDSYDLSLDAIKLVLDKMERRQKPEDRWACINGRRNLIEQAIRAYLGMWSKSINSDEWSLLLEKSLTARRFEMLDNIQPSHLFSKRSSPLYLTDLLALLKNPTVLPYLADRRSAIVRALDHVNRARADAHANELTDVEFSLALDNIVILEAEFCDQ